MLSSRLVKEKAKALGFSACGIAPVEEAKSEADYLAQWLAAGCHAGMTYMENRRAIRLNPAQLLEDAKSVISVALNYYPKQKLPADVPHIAYYAYGLSSHAIMGIPPLVEYIVEFQEESHNVVKPVICTEHKEVDILQVLLEPLSRIAGVYERTP